MKNELNLRSIEEYEKISENEAKKIFKELCELNDNSNCVDLNFIRRMLTVNNNDYPEIFLKLVTQYKLIDSLKNENSHKIASHNIVFNEDEFVNFITGQNTKDLLFEDNLDLNQKRFKIDDYAKIYELLAGNHSVISRDVLKKNIKEVLESMSPDGDKNDPTIDQVAEEQANEIIELLASREEGLTPEDFMNIMTSSTPFPDNFDDVL